MLRVRPLALPHTRVARHISHVPSPWGDESWRHDKTAFIRLCCDAVHHPSSEAKRQLYGFLVLAFGDVDVDKDGKINAREFDVLCEQVASMPRRFGLAPSWETQYDDDHELRTKARRLMFDAMDSKAGPARGWIGCAQFVDFAMTHIAGKVGILGKVGTLDPRSQVDFYHATDYQEKAYLSALEKAVNDSTSNEYAGFYTFLLTLFVETDSRCRAEITYSEFSHLLDRAAALPRSFGLAPAGTRSFREAERKAIFRRMDDTQTGLITFRKFLQWSVHHTAHKIDLQKRGKGYKK